MTALAARLAPGGLRRPRPTARLRLTLYYSVLFLMSGACLLAIPYLLVRNTTTGTITYDAATRTYTYVGPGGVSTFTSGYKPLKGTYEHSGFTAKQSVETLKQLRDLAMTQHAGELHQLLVFCAIALAAMAAVSVLLGWLVAGRVLLPLRTISDTARRISASNLHQRLALEGPDDEFKELGNTLDALLSRLDASFESQRRFVANASHELRTPLTVERTLLQVALADPDVSIGELRRVCEKLLASGADQERLIEALLTLASSERGLEEWAPLDLSDVAQWVLEHRARAKNAFGLAIEMTLAPAPTVGDTALTAQVVSNLLDNAWRYNVEGGKVEVRTGIVRGHPFVAVSNTGPVVPEAEVPRLLQPFQQLGTQRVAGRAGHGLGLAIVQAISEAHRAHLDVRPRLAGGLDVEVRFPSLSDATNGRWAEKPVTCDSHDGGCEKRSPGCGSEGGGNPQAILWHPTGRARDAGSASGSAGAGPDPTCVTGLVPCS